MMRTEPSPQTEPGPKFIAPGIPVPQLTTDVSSVQPVHIPAELSALVSPGSAAARPQSGSQAPSVAAGSKPAPTKSPTPAALTKPWAPPTPTEPATAAAIPKPTPTLAELALALALFAGAWALWHFLGLNVFGGQGIGTSALFIYLLVTSFVYLQVKGVKQDIRSALMLAAAGLGALPFALYGARDINFLLVCFETLLCLFWLMYACRTMIAPRLQLSIIVDAFNQTVIVPLANFGQFFSRGLGGIGRKRTGWRVILFTVVGLVVSLPILLLIISLLASSDQGFYRLLSGVFERLEGFEGLRYFVELILALPLAAYLFGAIYGNFARRHTGLFSESDLRSSFERAHVIPKTAVYAPLMLLIALYVVYFFAVGSYLFSGLAGTLPAEYTYAEYARQGFFELCAVATIDLLILAGIWTLVRREVGRRTNDPADGGSGSGGSGERGGNGGRAYPIALRVISGILALLTCMLIVTAFSKMFIYIEAYGLTPLRLYTSIFMLFMLVAFVLIALWHLRAFNFGRPMIIVALALTLAVSLTNTNALIANYNVARYLDGLSQEIDVDMLERLGAPAAPALFELASEASDPSVAERASEVLNYKICPDYSYDSDGEATRVWTSWNLEQHNFEQLYNGRIRELNLSNLG